MSKETLCGDCLSFSPYDPESPRNGGRCREMWLLDVYPNHSTLHTLESHGKVERALDLLADPNDTCFEGYPFPEIHRKFALLEGLS